MSSDLDKELLQSWVEELKQEISVISQERDDAQKELLSIKRAGNAHFSKWDTLDKAEWDSVLECSRIAKGVHCEM